MLNFCFSLFSLKLKYCFVFCEWQLQHQPKKVGPIRLLLVSSRLKGSCPQMLYYRKLRFEEITISMTTRQQLIPKLLWRYCSKNHYARCCTRIFSSSGGDNSSSKIDLSAVEYASEFKGPIVNQLWTARQEEKRKATAQLDEINFEDARVPADSVTKIKYNFSSDKFLRERYRNPFGLMRFGKVLEDLDALAGNIAFKHVRDPTIEIVTASVDRILLNGLPDLIYDQSLSGKVTYVGTSSMEIRMQCKCSGIEDSDAWIEGTIKLSLSFCFVCALIELD